MTFSKRSVVNLNTSISEPHSWINLLRTTDTGMPNGVYPGDTNDAGFAITTSAGLPCGGGLHLPRQGDTAGPYVVLIEGACTINISGNNVPWTVDGGAIVAGTGYTGNGGNHTYTNVPLTGGSGTGALATIVVASAVVTSVTITNWGDALYALNDVLGASNANLGGAGSGFSYTLHSLNWVTGGAGTAIWKNGVTTRDVYISVNRGTGSADSQDTLLNWSASAMDPNHENRWVTKLAMYHKSDETDYLAGNIYRRGWKQLLVDANPAFIRFMNPSDGCRWSLRLPPSYFHIGGYNLYNQVKYYAAGLSRTNMVFSAPQVTASGSYLGTPAFMTHGERCYAKCATDWSTAAGSTATGNNIVAIVVDNLDATKTKVTWMFGQIASLNLTNGGTGYTTGSYTNVALWGGSHGTNGATADITVNGSGVVTSAVINNPGSSNLAINCYAQGDVLTPDTGVIGNGTNCTIQVATLLANLYAVNDKIQFFINGSGMPEIDRMVGTILTVGVGDNRNVTVDINCSTFTAFTSGYLCPFVTLKVGTGNDRDGPDGIGFPVLHDGSQVGISFWYRGYMNGSIADPVFYFDKNLLGTVDHDGTKHMGAWNYVSGGYVGKTPVEFFAKLINELEEMIIAQGKQTTHGPISAWICCHQFSMLSIDPDYDANDNYAIKSVETMLNGANGFAGIPSRCDLLVEHANEPWNPTPSSQYLMACGRARWGTLLFAEYASLREAVLVNDVKTAFPNNPRIKFSVSLWDYQGMSNSQFGGQAYWENFLKCFATPLGGAYPANYMSDAAYPFSTSVPPIDHFDAYHTAPYFDGGPTWVGNNLDTQVTNWINGSSAGKKVAISSVTLANPAHVVCAEAHQLSIGQRFIFVDIVGLAGAYPFSFDCLSGVVASTNFSATEFDTNLSSVDCTAFTSGNVISFLTPTQETACANYLGWLRASAPANDYYENLTYLFGSICPSFKSYLDAYNKPHIGYEGWAQGMLAYGSTSQRKAFLTACQYSQSLASYMTDYMRTYTNQSLSFLPAIYFGLSTDLRWALAWPNSYNFKNSAGDEFSGMSPAWYAMQAYNLSFGEGGGAGGAGAVPRIGNQYGIYKTKRTKIPHV